MPVTPFEAFGDKEDRYFEEFDRAVNNIDKHITRQFNGRDGLWIEFKDFTKERMVQEMIIEEYKKKQYGWKVTRGRNFNDGIWGMHLEPRRPVFNPFEKLKKLFR